MIVRREGLWRACAGDRAKGEARVAGPGAARDGGRVWATGWGMGREGQGMWGRVRVRCVGVRVRLQRRTRVVSCRPGVWGRSLMSSAATASILQMSVCI